MLDDVGVQWTSCRCRVEFSGSKRSPRGGLLVTDGAGVDAAVAPQ